MTITSVAQAVELGPASGDGGAKMVTCAEYAPVAIPMEDLLDKQGRLMLNPDIEKRDFFSVSLGRGSLTLRAGGHVGYIPLNHRVVVNVTPRVPVMNLMHIVEFLRLPKTVLSAIRPYTPRGLWTDALVDLYASALVSQIHEIAVQGLLREYRREEEGSSFPRGRVLMAPTLQSYAARGVNHRAHTTWFARSPDNAPNRCLKYALWSIAQQYVHRPPTSRDARRTRRRLDAAYSVFGGAELDHTRRFLQDRVVLGHRDLPPLRAYYREALDVALAVIRQQGVLLEGVPQVGLRLPSLVLNMSEVFEAYVRRALQLHAVEDGWTRQVLDGNAEGSKPLYNDPTGPSATPDIVVRDSASSPLILEVKYIPVEGRSTRDAVNQAVTYAACYQTDRVVLVHPRGVGQAAGMLKLGDVGTVAVFQYRFDLNAIDMRAEATSFGQAVEKLLSRGC